MGNTMLRRILSYGVIAGLVVCIPFVGLMVGWKGPSLEHSNLSLILGYTTMLVALSTVFIAIKRHRDQELGGVIGFWPALAIGLGISVIAGIFYVLAWEAMLAITHMDFAGSYAKALIAQKKAQGVSGAALAKITAEMEAFKIQYANPFYRLAEGFTEIFPVGVLVSLVSAGLLCNRRFLPARRA
jgi:hypothetical protein